jgi:hypothetical protein
MAEFGWHDFLAEWSNELIATEDIAETLPPEVKASRWLGFPGVSEEEIARAETRLGKTLPPSYRAFLKVSNGWRHPGLFIDMLWPVEKIDWFRVHNQEWITEWSAGAAAYAAANPKRTVPNPDADDRYLPATLQISEVGDSAVFLLNPLIVGRDGEWQAWFFSNWNPGANRYPSFREMMEAERKDFLFVRDRQH